jgi:hypothetical protein
MVSLGGQVRTRGKAKNRQGVYLNKASVAQLEASRLPTARMVDRSGRTVRLASCYYQETDHTWAVKRL